MTQTINEQITVGPDWVDLTIAHPELANAGMFLQNNGRGQLRVVHNASSTAPVTHAGVVLSQNGIWGGNAAHIWVQCLNDSTVVTAGLI